MAKTTKTAGSKGTAAAAEMVFLAWSGDASHDVAKALREWLPEVLPSLEAFVSSKDLDLGGRWFTELSNALSRTQYGVLCVTSDNFKSPWMHFEAGMCVKQVDTARVCPLLFETFQANLEGPLAQFQGVTADCEGMNRLTKAINERLSRRESEEQCQRRFEKYWPDLEGQFAKIKLRRQSAPAINRSSEDLLGEVVSLLRDQRRVLSDPATLFPASYLARVMHDLFDDEQAYDRLLRFVVAQATHRGEKATIVGPTSLLDGKA